MNRLLASVPEDVCRRFAEAVPAPDIRERRARIGVAGKVLEVDDVRSSFSGSGQGCDAKRVYGDRGIKMGLRDIARDEVLDGAASEERGLESVAAVTPCGLRRPKEWPGRIVSKASQIEPRLDPFNGLGMERHSALLATLAVDLQDSVSARDLAVSDSQPREFPHAARGVGKHREDRTVTNTSRRLWIWCVDESAAVLRRETDRLSVARNRWCFHEVAMGRICAGVPIGLEIREERPEHRDLAPDGTIDESLGRKVIPPRRDLARADLGKLLQPCPVDSGEPKKES